ncbi:hypothetical protein [Leucobacter sp. cx-169]|uniref:hypothetical protein n=1 Tax=Leucobacter sp. cx-169 TaxID=2770549 RepID=UPI00165E0111|nr:hypothetical protein [Leucobacter sp. cx-169]MBC9927188.1 hypothetical protein [Leucobacter sp. cx-169]
MKTLTLLTKITGAVTVASILIPLLFLSSDGYAGLVAVVLCWVFIAPAMTVLTLLLGLSRSVVFALAPTTSQRARMQRLRAWAVLQVVSLGLVVVAGFKPFEEVVVNRVLFGGSILIFIASCSAIILIAQRVATARRTLTADPIDRQIQM